MTIRTFGPGNSVLAMPGSQVTATDVTLSTDPLSGGGIGSATTALNVDVKRTFTFTPHGPFNVALNGGPGPNQLVMNIGVMPAGGMHNNSTVTGSGVALDVSANPTTVTVNNLTLTDVAGGFSNVVVRRTPKVDLIVPNGALIATKVEVPQGGGVQNGLSGAFPVLLEARGPSANGNLLLTEFTRNGLANPSTLTLRSSNGTVTLGKVQAGNDAVTVNITGGIDFLPGAGGSLTTGGAVNLTSGSGNITLGSVDTSSGAGVVNITANRTADTAGGNIFARDAGPALEVSGGGTVTLRGQQMGEAGKPLNLAGPRIDLATRSTNGRIGNVDPLTAATSDLKIDTFLGQASAFTVDTTTVDLVNLDVRTVPSGGRVTSNGVNYDFGPTFAPPNPITQFNNGMLKFELTSGAISTPTDLTLGTIRLPVR